MAIYYLDVDDEITAAATRIRDSGDTRIAIVLQEGSRIATSRINFRLLAREAQRHGRKLAIVAADPSVRSLAQTAGLPVFASVGDYQLDEASGSLGRSAALYGADEPEEPLAAAAMRSPASGGWSGSGRPSGRAGDARGASKKGKGGAAGGARNGAPVVVRPPRSVRPRLSRWVGLAAVVGVVAAVGGGVFLWPSATVVVTLRAEQLGPTNLTIKVDPSITAANDATLTVPGVARSFAVQADGTFAATGENVVETAATGTVTFFNGNTGSAVSVAKGTQVETASGTAFATTAAVTIPAAKFTTPPMVAYGKADAPVTAVKKGTTGNVAAGAIVNVPPSLAAKLALPDGQVTNKQATTGGTHTVNQFIQQSDIDAAMAQLQGELTDSLKTKVAQQAATAGDLQLFASSAALGATAWDPAPTSLLDAEAGTFDLSVSATGTATGVSQTTVKAMAERKVRSLARSGFEVIDGSVKVSFGAGSSSGSVLSVPATVSAMQAPAIDMDELKAAIKGKTPEQAKAYLARYGQTEITIDPFWATTITNMDFRIDVQIVAPTPAPTPKATLAPRKTDSPTTTPSESATPTAGPSATAEATPTEAPTPAETPTPVETPTDAASATP